MQQPATPAAAEATVAPVTPVSFKIRHHNTSTMLHVAYKVRVRGLKLIHHSILTSLHTV